LLDANPLFLQKQNNLPEKLALHAIYFHLTPRATETAIKRMAEYDSTPDPQRTILHLSKNWEESEPNAAASAL
jgi:hypothetical protein